VVRPLTESEPYLK